MAKIKLTLQTNLEKATQDIKNLGSVTKDEQVRINAFAKQFTGKNIEIFTKKLEDAMKVARRSGGAFGEMRKAQEQLRKQMRHMVNNGTNPQSESIQKLAQAYKKVSREMDDYKKKLKQTEIQNQIKELNKLGYAMKTTGSSGIDILRKKHGALQGQIQQLIQQGYSPQSRELREHIKLYEQTGRRIDAYNTKLKQTEIQNQIKELNKLGYAMEATGSSGIDILRRKHSALQGQIQQLIKQGYSPQSRELREHFKLYRQTGGQINKFNQQLKKQQFLQNAAKVSMAKLGGAMKMFAGVSAAAVAGGLGLAGREYAKFDDALTSASAKWGASALRGTETFERLKQAARQIGATTEFTATQAAKGLDYLAMAGFKAQQSMKLLPKVVNLATAAKIELARASDIASDALGAFGMMSGNAAENAKNFQRISDVMAKTAAMANTDLPIMFESIKQGAAQFSAAGQDVETFSAMIGVMANSSIKGEKAGTQLRNMMLRLAKPAAEARKKLRAMNIVTTDANGNFKDAIDIVRQFEKAFKDMGSVQRAAALSTIFGSESITGMNILLKAGSKELEQYRNKLYNAGGEAARMAEVMRDSLAIKIKKLQSAFSDLGWQIMEALDERLRGGFDALIKVIGNIDVGPIVAEFQHFADVIKSLWDIGKVLVPTLIDLGKAMLRYKDIVALLTITVVLLKTAMNPGFAVLFAGAIVVAGGALFKYQKKVQMAKNEANKFNSVLKKGQKGLDAYGKAADELDPKMRALQERFGSMNTKELRSHIRMINRDVKATESAIAAMGQTGFKQSAAYAQALADLKNQQNEIKMAEEAIAQKRLKLSNEQQAHFEEFLKKRQAIRAQASAAIIALQQKEALGLIENSEVQKRTMEAQRKAAEDILALLNQSGYSLEASPVTMKMINEYIAKYRELKTAIEGVKVASMQDKLKVLHNQMGQQEQARLSSYAKFIQARMSQDQVEGRQRIAWLKQEQAKILALDNLSYAERKSARMQFAQEISKIELENLQKRIEYATQYSNQAMQIFSGISQIVTNIAQQELEEEQTEAEQKMLRLDGEAARNIERLDAELAAKQITKEQYDAKKDAYEKERDAKKAKIQAEMEKKRRKVQREAAIRSKAVNVAQATINTALAVTNALATVQPFIPNAIIAAAVASAAGAVQIGVAASTPIPAAETGGRFVVPPSPNRAGRVDGIGLRVNEGETIDVTPRGGAGRSITVQVNLDRDVLYKHVQEGFDSGILIVNQENIA